MGLLEPDVLSQDGKCGERFRADIVAAPRHIDDFNLRAAQLVLSARPAELEGDRIDGMVLRIAKHEAIVQRPTVFEGLHDVEAEIGSELTGDPVPALESIPIPHAPRLVALAEGADLLPLTLKVGPTRHASRLLEVGAGHRRGQTARLSVSPGTVIVECRSVRLEDQVHLAVAQDLKPPSAQWLFHADQQISRPHPGRGILPAAGSVVIDVRRAVEQLQLPVAHGDHQTIGLSGVGSIANAGEAKGASFGIGPVEVEALLPGGLRTRRV